MAKDDPISTAALLVRRRRYLFIFPALCGPVLLIVMKNSSLFNSSVLCGANSKVTMFLELFEGIILPRTSFEFNQILTHRGCSWFSAAIYNDLAITIMCLLIMFAYLRDSYSYPEDSFQRPKNITLMTTRQFSVATLIWFMTLVFAPAEFQHNSIYENYIDESGFFLVKEGLLITIGYYYLFTVMVNIYLSLSRVNRIFLPK